MLVDYLEDVAQELSELTHKLQKLNRQYRSFYDRDLKREITLTQNEIKKKKSDVKYELLLNLEEFRHLHKYFPELLQTFMEDEYIGPVLSKKAWLLEFKKLSPKEASAKLAELLAKRGQLKEAKKTLLTWVGSVDSRAFVATYPLLKGHLKGEVDKEEALDVVKKVDRKLRSEGWSLLINDSLIRIPVDKFMNKILFFRSNEMMAQMEFKRAQGKGTVAETNALKNLNKITRKKEHYENMVKQILLANPSYLKSLKKKRNWLSRERQTNFEKLVKDITPHTVKERSWLNEMKKKLESI